MLNVCRTLSCALLGAERVTEELSAKLGIKPGETDPSGTFTLMEVECLGACDRAPVVMVNDDWHEGLSPGAVREVRRRHPRARRSGASPAATCTSREEMKPVLTMAYQPVLTSHVREPNSYTLDFYSKNQRGYEGLRKALTQSRTTSSSR